MKQVKREGCGASDCIFNTHFRCIKNSIYVDETTKCLCYELE